MSQERREHCLKLWPSWGCATSRSPTSNGLCVCLSHGADVGFKSLLSALWPVLFPSPPPQGHLPSTLPCIPLPCIVRPFSTYSPLPFLPRTPKPPLGLPRLPTPTLSPLGGWQCFCPVEPALTGAGLWSRFKSPTRWAGLGQRLRNGKNGGWGVLRARGKGERAAGAHPERDTPRTQAGSWGWEMNGKEGLQDGRVCVQRGRVVARIKKEQTEDRGIKKRQKDRSPQRTDQWASRSLARLLPTCLWCLSGDPLARQLRLRRR